MSKNIALGRVGVPDDIGGVVSFLCSRALPMRNAWKRPAACSWNCVAYEKRRFTNGTFSRIIVHLASGSR
jgi:hypothetical protein